MKIAYAKLCEIFLQNDYYTDLQCPDLRIVPTPDCRKTMAKLGWILRGSPKGCFVFAKIKNTNPIELEHSIEGDDIVLRFAVSVQNPYFFHFTDLDRALNVGKNIFYFNNIRKPALEADKGRLADNPLFINPAYISKPIRLINSPLYRDILVVAPHTTQTTLTIEAKRNDETAPRTLTVLTYAIPNSSTNTSIDYLIDLSKINNMVEGRYTLIKTQDALPKTEEDIFYTPDLRDTIPLSIVELWASRGEQPFLNGDAVKSMIYTLRFATKDILLQYAVENVTIDDTVNKLRRRLDDIDIQDYTIDIEKQDTEIESGKALFTSFETLKWKDNMTVPILKYQNGTLQEFTLPRPQPSIAPLWDSNISQYVVKVFITL